MRICVVTAFQWIAILSLIFDLVLIEAFIRTPQDDIHPAITQLPEGAQCLPQFITQPWDHFDDKSKLSFQQRYFLCVRGNSTQHSVIFFYTGNEGDANMYRLHTGLMWESSEEFNALLIFAEHRFYGTSTLCGNSFTECGQFLRVKQVLEDYAALIRTLQRDYSITQTVAFGGSYGGMLAAYLRVSHPELVVGAIASSAPVNGLITKFMDDSYFDVVQSNMATCDFQFTRNAFETLLLQTFDDVLIKRLGLCPSTSQLKHGMVTLMTFILSAFDTLAMANYPYNSNYFTQSDELLPPFPVTEACKFLTPTNLPGQPTTDDYLDALKFSIGVYYNVSKTVTCYDLIPSPSSISDIWDYQVCSECLPQEIPYYGIRSEFDGGIFWFHPSWTESMFHEHCKNQWNVVPDCSYIEKTFGDFSDPKKASNIIFTNGSLDPWSSAGVTAKENTNIDILVMNGAAHHLDLMFANPADPPDVVKARAFEVASIRKWLGKPKIS